MTHFVCGQALGRSYAVDDDIDEAELDDELAALDEQLALESEVRFALKLIMICSCLCGGTYILLHTGNNFLHNHATCFHHVLMVSMKNAPSFYSIVAFDSIAVKIFSSHRRIRKQKLV